MFYRLRKALQYGWFKFRTRRIHRTQPIACDPTAGCEIPSKKPKCS